jgi:hypothetical protein
MTASGTIKLTNVDQMTKTQRRELANWLKQQASDLLVDGAQYADKFTTHSQTYTVGGKQ